jgi:hypothetical protein
MRVEKNKDYQFDADQYLYKYMDLHRLIYFLHTGKLFFSPLSYFDDPLEGISENLLYNKLHTDDEPERSDTEKRQRKNHFYKEYLEKVQQTLFASCWFLGTRESLAMWEAYSNNDSVAIRFDPEHLCEVMISNFKKIDDSDFELMVHGKVEYFKLSPFDPNDETLKNGGHKFNGFIKDLSYKHEEEFRFLLMQTKETRHCRFYEFTPGKLSDIDFTVISHPYMEDWKYNNISNILSQHSLEDRLVKSEIPTRHTVLEIP